MTIPKPSKISRRKLKMGRELRQGERITKGRTLIRRGNIVLETKRPSEQNLSKYYRKTGKFYRR